MERSTYAWRVRRDSTLLGSGDHDRMHGQVRFHLVQAALSKIFPTRLLGRSLALRLVLLEDQLSLTREMDMSPDIVDVRSALPVRPQSG